MRFPRNMPRKPSTIITRPTSSKYIAPSLRLRLPPLKLAIRSSSRPTRPNSKMPCRIPIIRRLSRMSPLRMWLNSWAITPCSWSRESCSTQPCVHADHGVAGRKAGGKRVNALLALHHEHRWHGDAGGEAPFPRRRLVAGVRWARASWDKSAGRRAVRPRLCRRRRAVRF